MSMIPTITGIAKAEGQVPHELADKLVGNLVRALSWYENEWDPSNRMTDTAIAMAKKQ